MNSNKQERDGAGKSVAVITFHSWINGNLNYGASLQAYALCKAVNQLGHSVELIDYIPEVIGTESKLKNIYRRIFRFFISRKVPRNKRIGFQDFINKYCFLGKRKYRSLDALVHNPPAAEVYVSGSDQVWNTRIFHGSLFPAFFLGFGPASKKRVSYASSFGTHAPDLRLKSEISNLLKQFSAIAVRENSGIEVVETMLGDETSVTSVLDPTLLLQDYEDISESMNTEGMLLAYLFKPTEEDIELLRQTAKRLLLKPSLIWDNRMEEFKGIELIECNSPSQWLGAMKNADSIITNSFHGTVFSVLFEHPFVSLLGHDKEVANRNTRVLDLVSKLGVENNSTVQRDVDVWLNVLKQPISWSEVNERLSRERDISLKYLQGAIQAG
ncbi:polysaccharide pyruvyl transferase family protein [Pontiellaceae bacterium B12227]|nr:polysaccharide pyruvyl transferase family protein [Pontiellaceae bacterium B12227]